MAPAAQGLFQQQPRLCVWVDTCGHSLRPNRLCSLHFPRHKTKKMLLHGKNVFLPFLLLLGSALLTCHPVAANLVVISEFLASNVAGRLDKDGEPSDWVEIHNAATDSAIDLTGWTLTDKVTLPGMWAFPAGVTLPPDGFLVVFCSGKNLAVAGSELHTNFKLGASGEYLGLYNGASVSSEYAPVYPAQTVRKQPFLVVAAHNQNTSHTRIAFLLSSRLIVRTESAARVRECTSPRPPPGRPTVSATTCGWPWSPRRVFRVGFTPILSR
jgi:hypothetical protein